jgi:hypothetical protein
MSVASACQSAGRAICRESLHAAALRAAYGLRFAAGPTFAVMALLTGAHSGDASPLVCSGAPGASPLSGMATMYWLMCVLHAAPWLKALSNRGPTPRT